MKIGESLFVVLGVWTVYELYNNHNIKATSAAMQKDISALKSKVGQLTNFAKEAGGMEVSKTGDNMSSTPATLLAQQSIQTATPTSNNPWSNYVGQPRVMDVYDSPQDQVKHYTGTDYYSQFRKKPAFAGFTGWKY